VGYCNVCDELVANENAVLEHIKLEADKKDSLDYNEEESNGG